MAYVPPHKRLPKNDDGEGSSQSPIPKPELPPFLINYKNPKHKYAARTTTTSTAHYRSSTYEYEDIFRWFAAGLDDRHHFPPSVHLQPVSVESFDGKILKRLALFNNIDSAESSNSVTESCTRRPWEYIAENVMKDLLSCFEDIRRNTMEESDQNHGKVTPTIITRIGKVFFRGGRSDCEQKSVTRISLSEEALRPLRGSFYTKIPVSFIEYLVKEGASKSGLGFEQEKEVYRVFFRDASQPDVCMCKCRVLEDGKLNLYKIEHSYTRHMLRDISCLEKNLDIRLDLCTKRTVTNLPDDHLESLKNLINSAVVDREVKGGLTWPKGKAFLGGKLCVVGVWRTRGKTYKNQTLRLKIRDVERSPPGEATTEVVIMLKGVASELTKQDADRNLISEMLKNDLKVIWNNILCCERFPKDITDEDIDRHRPQWFAVGLDDLDQFPPSIHLLPFSSQSPQQKYVVFKALALINSDLAEKNYSRVKESFTIRPWEYIAENVLQELLSYFKDWRSEREFEDVIYKPTIIVRFGKVLFFWPSIGQEFVTKNSLSVDALAPLKRSFHTNIPNSYVKYITREGASKSGLEFEKEKVVYRVYIQPCYMRNLLKNISCLEKNLDMRLDVIFKKTTTDLNVNDMQMIRDLIGSAIVDSNVQGGLRWPLGKTVSGDKFCVRLVSHTTTKIYKCPSLKLKINDVDQYEFKSSKGLATKEVVMSLKGLSSELLKREVDTSVINEMLKNELKVLWDNFLYCESFTTLS
ncbi:uncharacterized protein LOC133791327 [Humulus lupulus]|uniref:uncharacterized protein LOC133791327 n=1 Tax=Humulus lupulus TaxID=3486 RepID=UPI002B40C8F4|nr:uncharacterized protein LOC133791327 [Humulus lupulus]